jgi:16S rRNA G527 N7-methylase RsmG
MFVCMHRPAQMHDLAVARAVADTRVLLELCLPFVMPGGVFVAAKGPNPEVW